MFSHDTPQRRFGQGKIARNRRPEKVAGNPIFNLVLGWNGRRISLCIPTLGDWDNKAETRDGLRLSHILDVYPRGVPWEVRARYGLEDDFSRLQRWRGYRSGMFRRFRTARRDAEIRELIEKGNSMRSVASYLNVSVGLVHYVYHRRLEAVPSACGPTSAVRVAVGRKEIKPDSYLSPPDKSLYLESGSLNGVRSMLEIAENMMIADGFRAPPPELSGDQKGQFELFQGMPP